MLSGVFKSSVVLVSKSLDKSSEFPRELNSGVFWMLMFFVTVLTTGPPGPVLDVGEFYLLSLLALRNDQLSIQLEIRGLLMDYSFFATLRSQ